MFLMRKLKYIPIDFEAKSMGDNYVIADND